MEALHDIRAELVARLRARSAEIEDTVYNRVRQMADPVERDDPEYRAYLRATVAEAIDYALLGIERGEDWEGPIPEAAMVQARRAARTGVKLDAVLRRYAAGDRLVGEFVVDEAAELPNEAMRPLVRAQGPHVDRMMAAVATEYMDELERLRRSPAQRIAERVQRLLAADSPVDAAGLDYELDAWHLGLVITSSRPDVAARTLSAGLNRQLLVVPQGDDSAWAWLGGRGRLAVIEVERYLATGAFGRRDAGRWRAALRVRGLAPHPLRGAGGPAGDAAPAAALHPGQRRGVARRGAARRAPGQVAARDLPRSAR